MKSVYTGLGQLLYHGRAINPGVPLALFIGAAGYDTLKSTPILVSGKAPNGESLEGNIRARLAILGISLIICAKLGADEYVLNGGQQFLDRVERYWDEKPTLRFDSL